MKKILYELFNVLEKEDITLNISSAENSSSIVYSIESPCEDINCMNIYFNKDEILISIQKFHTHISLSDCDQLDEDELVFKAANIVRKIVKGSYYFHEVSISGTIMSSGGGVERLNLEERNIFKVMYGKDVEINEWNWFGVLE